MSVVIANCTEGGWQRHPAAPGPRQVRANPSQAPSEPEPGAERRSSDESTHHFV